MYSLPVVLLACFSLHVCEVVIILMPTAHLGSGSMRCTTVESACELAVCWQLGVPPVVTWKRSKARYLVHGVQAQLGGS